MSKQQATDKAIARYTRFGNEERGREILAELVAKHSGCNLASALFYWNFATQHMAQRMADAFDAE